MMLVVIIPDVEEDHIPDKTISYLLCIPTKKARISFFTSIVIRFILPSSFPGNMALIWL